MKRLRHFAVVLIVTVITANALAKGKVHAGEQSSCYSGPIEKQTKETSNPRVVRSQDPDYTDAARRAKIQGVVVVRVIITPVGRACPEKVVRGLSSDLDENAMKALGLWKFEPAVKDGKPIAVRLNVEVVFRLH